MAEQKEMHWRYVNKKCDSAHKDGKRRSVWYMSPENVIHNISASYKTSKECLDGSSLMIYKKIIHIIYLWFI
jgi:hypothetical protein